MNCLTACKERKHFASWIKKAESIPEMGKLGLADWLIKAVKRVPQYVLLLTQVQKALPKGCHERQVTKTAKILIKELAEWINERKKAVENSEKLNLIQANLYGRIPSLRQNGRVFVKETIVLEKKIPKGRIYQKKLYLFNDAMLFAYLDGKFDKMVFLSSSDLRIFDPKQPLRSSSRDLGSLVSTPSSPDLSAAPEELHITVEGRAWAIIFSSGSEMHQWQVEIRHLVDDLKWLESNSPTKEFEAAPTLGVVNRAAAKLIESKVEKEGWLMKASGAKGFRKRWFMLELGYLFYFKSKPSGEHEIQTSKDMRHIDLNSYFVRENEKHSSKKKFCFELHNAKQKNYLFAVETKEERDTWIEAIQPYTLFGKKKSSKDALAVDMVINPQQDLLQFSSSGSDRKNNRLSKGSDASFVDDDDANLTLEALTASRFYWQEESDERGKMSGSTASLPGGGAYIPPLATDKVPPAPLDDSDDGAVSPTYSKEQIASAFGEPEKKKHRKKGSRESSSRSSIVVLPTTAETRESKSSDAAVHKRKLSKENSKSKITSPTSRRDSSGSSSAKLATVLPPVVLRADSKVSKSGTLPPILPPPEAPKRQKRHSLKRSLSLNEAEANHISAAYYKKSGTLKK